MHKVILILDKFFLKYENSSPPLPKKLPSKSPVLLGLTGDNEMCRNWLIMKTYEKCQKHPALDFNRFLSWIDWNNFPLWMLLITAEDSFIRIWILFFNWAVSGFKFSYAIGRFLKIFQCLIQRRCYLRW